MLILKGWKFFEDEVVMLGSWYRALDGEMNLIGGGRCVCHGSANGCSLGAFYVYSICIFYYA